MILTYTFLKFYISKICNDIYIYIYEVKQWRQRKKKNSFAWLDKKNGKKGDKKGVVFLSAHHLISCRIWRKIRECREIS